MNGELTLQGMTAFPAQRLPPGFSKSSMTPAGIALV